jgi:ribosomal protein S18 acetylase RimI-like enzyme
MGMTYFKRFRMEISLLGRTFGPVRLPSGYRFVPWSDSILESHAEAKYLSFRSEVDANVFPCLGEYDGCLRLMHEIRRKEGFLPGATLLVVQDQSSGSPQVCGTIQGIRDPSGIGAVQNLGVAPEYRGLGLGSALMLKSLEGYQLAGLRRTFLEVTAQNASAIRLYQQLGFAKVRTVYKAVEVAYT